MGVLQTIGSTAYTASPTPQSFGPYSVNGNNIQISLTPTVWPASGDVLDVTFTFQDGSTQTLTLSGCPLGNLRGGVVGGGFSPQGAQTVSISALINQNFTASLVATST